MATQEYDKNNTTRINLKLNNKTDADIIEKLGEVENVQGFIKAIIRNEMEGAGTMKHFEKKTEELYGARNAGYKIDRTADREEDAQLLRRIRAERGDRFVEDKRDALYDFDGDLYQDENGDFYTVVFVWDHDHEVPLFWNRLTKAEYRIKPEFIEYWGPDATDETVLTMDEIKSAAEGFEKSIDDVMEQVYLNEPAEVEWYRALAEKENRYHH